MASMMLLILALLPLLHTGLTAIPSRPVSLTEGSVHPTNVELLVTPAEDAGDGENMHYVVIWGGAWTTAPYTPGQITRIKIENLRPSTAYIFEVAVSNEEGQSEPSTLHVTTAAIREPYPVTITSSHHSRHGDSYNLEWEKPESGGLPIREYQVKYRQVEIKPETSQLEVESPLTYFTAIMLEDDPQSPLQSYELTNLAHGSYYEVEVRARNVIGWSSPTSFVFTTASVQIPSRPASLTEGFVHPTSVELLVTPAGDAGDGENMQYVISWDGIYQQTAPYTPGQITRIKIENLRPSTAYIFNVVVSNEERQSEPITLYVTTAAIREPYRVTITSSPHSSVDNSYYLEWEKPETGGLPIKEYQLRYRLLDTEPGEGPPSPTFTTIMLEDDPQSPRQSYTITNLHGSHYEVRVRARNDIGWSELSSIVITTEPEP